MIINLQDYKDAKEAKLREATIEMISKEADAYWGDNKSDPPKAQA